MKNWRAALQEYLEQFGLPVYAESSVEEDAVFPWMTFSRSRNDFAMETSETLHLHYYTASEAVPNAKADEICDAIRKGPVIRCEEGKLILNTGSPEWITVSDGVDKLHKHRVINLTITWLLTR